VKPVVYPTTELKNITAGVAEHAEGKTAKVSRYNEKKGLISNGFRNRKTPKGLSEKDLCVLRFLLVHPLIFMRGGSWERKSFIPKGKNDHKPQRSGRTQRR
jgi:hypothetical protein